MIDCEPILQDPLLNEKLFREGYTTLPLLNQVEVDQLKVLFWMWHTPSEIEGLYVTASKKNDKTIHIVSDSIQDIFKRAIAELVKDGQTLGGTFIAKPPHQTEALEPHQDWSIVDESRFRSYTIWVPLTNVDEHSGCMYVLPKSHDSMRGYRHLTIPSIFGQIYDHVWQHMIPIRLKAGEAIIFDHALGHASKPNRSDKVRIAATHSLLSSNAEMRFYWNNNEKVEEYQGESDYYNTEEAKLGPGHLKKIRDVDFEIKQLDQTEFDTLAGVVNQSDIDVVKKNWFQRIFG